MKNLAYLFILMLAAQYTFDVAALRAEPEISIWPSSTSVSTGDTFELNILISDAIVDLMGYSLTVWFNDMVLGVQNVTEGDLLLYSGHQTFFEWTNQGSVTNSISVNGAILGNTVSGPGWLCTLTFEAIQTGTSGIHFIESDLRDNANNSIGHARNSGMVYVDWTIMVKTGTWGAIKSLYR